MFINLNPHLDLGFFYFLKSFCKIICLIVYFSLHLLIINYNIMGADEVVLDITRLNDR